MNGDPSQFRSESATASPLLRLIQAKRVAHVFDAEQVLSARILAILCEKHSRRLAMR